MTRSGPRRCRPPAGNKLRPPSLCSRFPLQDPVRLQRWLRNMGREDWTPSRHQYVCHQHFSPSCFRVRWGIRYLEGDAVPTLFQQSEVRRDDRRAIMFLCLLVSVDQSQLGGGVDPSEVGEPDSCPETDLDSQGQVDGGETGGDVPFCQSGDLTGSVENLEVVVVSETQDELVKGLTATILNGGGSLSSNGTSCPVLFGPSRYHRDSLSKEQLEAIVAELQKKVKVLQQRHRRHLEKLVGLESTVSRLRQSNLLNEERLQLLERVIIRTRSRRCHR
uniref:THAP-type domain-containing protein n=1 Tax=Kryptolebias marmoratus TaxID=37003 RepID=A0A3Q3GMT3_KRYMA